MKKTKNSRYIFSLGILIFGFSLLSILKITFFKNFSGNIIREAAGNIIRESSNNGCYAGNRFIQTGREILNSCSGLGCDSIDICAIENELGSDFMSKANIGHIGLSATNMMVAQDTPGDIISIGGSQYSRTGERDGITDKLLDGSEIYVYLPSSQDKILWSNGFFPETNDCSNPIKANILTTTCNNASVQDPNCAQVAYGFQIKDETQAGEIYFPPAKIYWKKSGSSIIEETIYSEPSVLNIPSCNLSP